MEPFIGEIKMFGGNFAPLGWAKCDGQLLPIAQNDALFSLLGTAYGGDGRTTFGLPDLRGRVPMHEGTGPGLSNKRLGEKGGEEGVILTPRNMPAQTYTADLSTIKGKMAFTTDKGDTNTPSTGNVFAVSSVSLSRSDIKDVSMYKNASTSDQTKDISISGTLNIDNKGGSQGHSNMQPFLALNYIIALQGIYPSRN